MPLATYTDLQTSVQGWLARGDALVTSRIPDFIALGEERIWRDLRVSDMITTLTLTVPNGANSVALPADFLEFKRITTAGYMRLDYMAADQLADLTAPGRPNVYSIEGRTFIYGQTVGASTAFSARYYARAAALAITPTNWLLTKAPSVYLYAALVEAYIFVKNPEEAARYGVLLDKAIREMESADQRAMSSGASLRQRPR
ncbi:phage adaptor protein [Variovorax sp. PAMC 28711]|uniref:phage adaptor protein n=1 Tax=Variovorax sp. PAMC 28711 TaxID=1795631 RepID=UPI00078C8E35|nr:hypothetical protein [Variovorax sp. PAMC 28711]AMM22991.1 hypothetical protein AX767_00300 [Variovorax sp. PAMC 28711]